MDTSTASPLAPPALTVLSRNASQPLAQQLAQRFAARIHQRLLLPGARLPSVRDCARNHGVSPYTVVAAYDQLLAQGLLEARKKRGFFVRETRPQPMRPSAPGWVPANAPLPPPVDAGALIRGMFQADARRSPGLGTLPAEWLDLGLLQGTLRRLTTQADDALLSGYGDPLGDQRLREALSVRLLDLSVQADPSQIMSTVGATHGLDLTTRAFLKPGDAVLVDEPGWAIEYARLSQAGMRLLPVPRGELGPDLAVMRRLVAEHRPRMYVTVSVLHNPTGAMLSLASAHQILRIAHEADLLIVEDDTYAFFAPNHAPRLAALDQLQRTIYISGFSKMLSPAWRVGFVAASPDRIAQLTELKLLASLTTSPLMDRAVALCLEQGLLRRHAERVSARLVTARQRCMRLAEDAGFRFVAPPAGLFGWVDVGVDTERLAQPMMDQGWLIAPGILFSPTRQPGTLMRINFATSQDARFWRALAETVERLHR
ncbi:DNA-binding transcriptional regulator, MocR family, contains an aminotransferase domain [Roseateles sp. YR242]|uniref:aminotransferase-like domain-containing protein n=1 Tax=Roseateles sp. YR242 TaxID=1855305 RepID=UPI0008D81F03|nr:PLP-dependent aminotransferase family protein [Roseateles sp. YR242]SEK77995.1 DNA-binding transcriptional regulator, MocR family, contains an aminotransferase domain [Roseateles sp. YR242]